MQLECRFLQGETTLTGNKVAGYAVVYNSPSEVLVENGRRFIEIIKPGALTRALADAKDIRALVNHDRQKLLGRTSSGTLKLREDTRGLAFELELPDTTDARDLKAQMERGDITGASFRFAVPKGGDSWSRDTTGTARELRHVNQISRLEEISIVDTPAYPEASAALRSLEAWEQDQQKQANALAALSRRVRLAEID
jgi:uncharacterized protein